MTSPPQTTPSLALYHFPGACSQVCVFALEHAGLPYELRLVDLKSSEQTGPDYMAISPTGKVPALLIDGAVLTENAAIQTYVAALRPQAGLFPADTSPLALAHRQAGLSLCGGGLHPIVRGLANPGRITDGDPEPVRSRSTYLAHKTFGHADAQLAAHGGWWLGTWSLVDVYLNWAVSVAARAGFDFGSYPQLGSLQSRLMAVPAFARMLEIEAESTAALERRRAQAAG